MKNLGQVNPSLIRIEHDTLESQQKAKETSQKVLQQLFEQFPISENYYNKFVLHNENKATAKLPADYSFIYGKWMQNSLNNDSEKQLNNDSVLSVWSSSNPFA